MIESDGPVAVIISDGWTKDLFLECLESGTLPEIKSELVDRGSLFTDVVSVFPSVSLASHTTLLTGTNPSIHRIPGHRWLAQTTQHKTSYIGLGGARVNEDISTDVSTLFEMAKPRHSVAIQSVINRGASKRELVWGASSSNILDRTLQTMRRTPNVVTVSWLPKGDIVSHTYGPRSKRVVEEMKSTSRSIGRLCKRLREIGLYDSTKIVFTSDHGQKEVSKICRLNQAIDQFGYTAAQNCQPRRMTDFLILTNGDSSAYVYSMNPKVSPNEKQGLLEKLVQVEGVDLAFQYFGNDKHYVFSAVGTASIEVAIWPFCNYKVEYGLDPLGLENLGVTTKIDLSVPSKLNGSNRYPDVVHQYLTSIVAERSADILLSASEGYHFGAAPRFAWRFGFHRGSHGGPTRSEMLFPAIITGRGEQQVVLDQVRSKDLLTMI